MAPSPSDCANPLARRISLYFVPEDSFVACLATGRVTSLASLHLASYIFHLPSWPCVFWRRLLANPWIAIDIRPGTAPYQFCLCLCPLHFTLAFYPLLHFLSASLGEQRSWLLSLPPAKLISTSPQAPFPPLLLPTQPFNIPPPGSSYPFTISEPSQRTHHQPKFPLSLPLKFSHLHHSPFPK